MSHKQHDIRGRNGHEAVLESHRPSTPFASRLAPSLGGASANARGPRHMVQFYETDDFLVQSVCDYVATALDDGQGAVVIATPAHRERIHEGLAQRGRPVTDLMMSHRLVSVDAAATLARFMVQGRPDPDRFVETIATCIDRASCGTRAVSAFGEMVALLWADGNREGALELERLWRVLQGTLDFSLLCGYPMRAFPDRHDADDLGQVCDCHSDVTPAELPVASSRPAHSRSLGAAAESQAPAGRRVLVADDNPDAAESLSLVLQLMGFEVKTAGDGLAAVELVDRFRPDVVLLDIGMPGLDGYGAARRNREQPRNREVLLVALTGWGQDEDRRRTEEAGFDLHLVKPVEPERLRQLLTRVNPATP